MVFETTHGFEKTRLAKDIREMNGFLRKRNKTKDFIELAKPSLLETFLAILLDWTWVFVLPPSYISSLYGGSQSQ